MSRFLDRLVERSDDILLAEIELAVFVCPSIQVLAERESGYCQIVAVDHLVLQQECQDFYEETGNTR